MPILANPQSTRAAIKITSTGLDRKCGSGTPLKVKKLLLQRPESVSAFLAILSDALQFAEQFNLQIFKFMQNVACFFMHVDTVFL